MFFMKMCGLFLCHRKAEIILLYYLKCECGKLGEGITGLSQTSLIPSLKYCRRPWILKKKKKESARDRWNTFSYWCTNAKTKVWSLMTTMLKHCKRERLSQHINPMQHLIPVTSSSSWSCFLNLHHLHPWCAHTHSLLRAYKWLSVRRKCIQVSEETHKKHHM